MSGPGEARVRVEESDSDGGDEYTEAPTVQIRDGSTILAPLKNTRVPREPLPPLEHDQSVTTQGGSPRDAGDTTISLPHGGGSYPEQHGDTIIAMQGKQRHGRGTVHPSGPTPRQKPLPSHVRNSRGGGTAGNAHSKDNNSLDMVVYFQDKSGIHLTVEDGQHMEAGELFEVVMEEMKYPQEMREVFSLWLVSDLLELQLKPNHVPFKLVCYWEELLEKYTCVDEDDRERDEPVLMFQRNVFYPRWKEREIKDRELIRLLFNEAKEMIIDGRYPLKPDEYDFLAGVQAQLIHKSFDAREHTPEYYRQKLTEYYPDNMARTKWKVPGIARSSESPEFRLARCHQQCHQRYNKLDNEDVIHKLHMVYMQFCWDLPFYGSAFFHGQIEHPGSNFRLFSLDDDPVWVAVNTDGVYVLDMDDVLFLIGLPFQKLSWEYGEPADKNNPDCMPCLFLSYPAEEGGQKVTKMLQVFSKEAVLADAMIEACIGLKQAEKATRPSKDMKNDMEAITKATGETWERFNRMCVATFSRKGKVIKNPARVPKRN